MRLHLPAQPTVGRGVRVFSLYMLRTIILLALGLPYVMAGVMVYRPKVSRATIRGRSWVSISARRI